MKRPKMLIALALGTLLVAAQATAQTGAQHDVSVKARASQCPKVAVSSVEKPYVMPRSFSATRSADLIFHILFNTKPAEDHVVTLKVFTPKGHLYRQFDVPLASGTEKRYETARRLPGYPNPVPVQTTSTMKAGKRKYESLDIPFPVAGSAIVTSSLYGRWNVEVFLDGAAEPCGRPTFFFLRD
jgi:hypothetical protein